jgi:hypothetical protein
MYVARLISDAVSDLSEFHFFNAVPRRFTISLSILVRNSQSTSLIIRLTDGIGPPQQRPLHLLVPQSVEE